MFVKTQKIVAFLLIFYTLVGFFAVPLILKSQLTKIVNEELNAKLSIESIYFNPFAFRVIIDKIKLSDLDDKHLFYVKSLDLNLEPHSLYKPALHIKHLILQRPKVSVVYKKDKTVNLATILKSKKTQEQSDTNSSMPRLLLDKISIVNGCVDYEDYASETPFDLSFENIGFSLVNIDTKDFQNSDATLRFYTSLGDGGFLDIKSQLLNLEPLEISGNVNFEASKLYSQWKYVQDNLNLEVADGEVSFKANYYFNLDNLEATTIENLELYIDKLRVKPKSKNKDVLNLENFLLTGATIKPMLKVIHIKNIALDSFDLKAQRDKDGVFDWSEYIKTSFASSEVSQEIEDTNETKPWNGHVEEVRLQNIKLDFIDEGIEPNVTTKLNDFDLFARNISFDGEEALEYNFHMMLNDEFVCDSNGAIKHKTLDIKSKIACDSLDVVKFKPYIDEAANDMLALYDLNLKQAKLGFDANLSVKKQDDEMQINLSEANLKLSDFLLHKTTTDERLLDFKDFRVDGLDFESKTKKIDIKKTTLDGLNIFVSLHKDGSINLDKLVEVKASKEDVEETLTSKEEEFRVKLEHFELNSAGVSFTDESLESELKTKLDNININAHNIDSKKNTWLKYDVNARLNRKGIITTKGELRHTPLKQKSEFKLRKISLKNFSPYIESMTYIKLDDGYVNLDSKIEYEKSENKPDIRVYGDLNVKEFFLHDTRDDSTIFSFSTMKLNSFEYEMSPDRVYIDEVDLEGLFVNAVINKSKVLNFATLSKAKTQEAKAQTKEDVNQSQNSDFDFKVMKLNVASGNAKFEDLSLPIDFKTDIHGLNGVVYSISNQNSEISYVDIAGEVNKYGSTKLTGSIDSSDPKAYLDLDFNFRNLELKDVSGYSANFAGYKIDEGKLFLDLGYKIVDSNLLGKNSIIIKNIKLGEKIEDENVTSLPLGFAIALLEDSDGVIDIDMPVEGNVDAPDFKYATLVLKTFANLIVKAVASPFKFLGSMLGLDGEKLDYIEFESGYSTLLAPEREKLDNILKIMLKRPKISLKITPQYDEKEDAFMLKREKLLLALMKKSGVKSKKEQLNSLTVELLEEIYEEMNAELKLKDIEKSLKEKYNDEVLKREYMIELIKQATALQELTQKELDDLANARGEVLREYLVDAKSLPSKRLIIQEAQEVEKSQESWVRLKLNIEVQ